jgi:thioredoxin-related protein
MLRSLIAVALVAMALLAPAASLAAEPAPTRDPNGHFFETTLGDLRGELASAKQQGKLGVLVVFEMDDCPYCHRMHQTVLNRAEVQDYFRSQFIVLRIDIRGDSPLEDFSGQQTTEKAFAREQKIVATPTFIFYGLDGQPLTRFPGLARDAGEFLQLGRYVVDGAYRTTTFAAYRQKRPAQ